jgi:shikimate kinase
MVGLMATGKTVVADGVAARLGVAVSDNDRSVVAQTGLTAREIRLQQGVAALHELEARHLLDALCAAAPTVISSAASVVDDGRCRSALEEPGVLPIWLRATASTLTQRFHNEPHRPIFADDLEEFFASQIAIRSAQFRAVSAATIDVDTLDVGGVIERVVAIVESHGSDVPEPAQSRSLPHARRP